MSGRKRSFCPGISPVFLLIACLSLCAAVSNENIFTIDDASSSGRFHTSPTIATSIPLNSTDSTHPQWTHENCSSCLVKPDLAAVHRGTYTAVYLPPGNIFQYNISFEFNGNAVDVYLILSKQAPTSCTFILDGEATLYTGYSVDAFQYKTLAFSSDVLPSQTHTLTITAEGEPNRANYINFDFANFTRSSPMIFAVTSTNATDPDPSMPSSTPNNHTTLKAIIGGVVGGFIAVVVLITVAAFYRSRRLRELEEEAYPFTQTRSRNETGVNVSRPPPNEREHLIPYTFPAPTSPHHERGKSSTIALGVTPYDFNRPPHRPSNIIPENRDQLQEERRLQLNNRLEAVTTQMRSLKASYVQDQARLHDAPQRQRQRQDIYFEMNENTANPSTSDPPPSAGGVSRPASSMTVGGGNFPNPSNRDRHPTPVPVRMPEPCAPAVEHGNLEEPMVNPHVLADMRTQMGIMMDQIQYLRAQQNTSYVQGLTDEPPPGYLDAISSYHRSS